MTRRYLKVLNFNRCIFRITKLIFPHFLDVICDKHQPELKYATHLGGVRVRRVRVGGDE